MVFFLGFSFPIFFFRTTYLLKFQDKYGKELLYPNIQGLRHLFHKKSVDIFLISPLKYMLWALIRKISMLMSTHKIHFHEEIGKLQSNLC